MRVTYVESVKVRCRAAIDHGDAGDLLAARDALGDLWPDPHGVDDEVLPLALLAVGMVMFWIAMARGESFEPAKDLLSESARLYGNDPLSDRARIFLAAAYNRQGGRSEALAGLDDVLSRTRDPEIRVCAATTKAAVQSEIQHYEDALRTLADVRKLLEGITPTRRGSFHNQEGMVYRQLGELDCALSAYTAAQYFFEVARNRRFEARVFNNLAHVYIRKEMFDEAHKHVDVAVNIYTRLRDDAHLAQAKDTKADILLKEGKAEQALAESTDAVRLLRGDDRCWLPSILITRASVLVRLKREHDAKEDLLRAVMIAEETGNLSEAGRAYLSMVEWLSLPVKERAEYYRRADDLSNDIDRLRRCARKIISAIHPPREKHDYEQERELIKNTLLANGKNVEKAAVVLGLSGPGLARIIDHDPHLIPFRKTKRVRRTRLIKK